MYKNAIAAKYIIHKLWVSVEIMDVDTILNEFENCIWHNEIPSDQLCLAVDQMMALTFPMVCSTNFEI